MSKWTPPGNRSNQHIKRWHAELYVMPKSDKTGYLTRLTQDANTILANITYKYRVGLRVVAKTANIRYGGKWITGDIRMVNHNMGLNEYVIRTDDGERFVIAEHHIVQVLSIQLAA